MKAVRSVREAGAAGEGRLGRRWVAAGAAALLLVVGTAAHAQAPAPGEQLPAGGAGSENSANGNTASTPRRKVMRFRFLRN